MTEKGLPPHTHKVNAGLRLENEFPCADPSCPVDAMLELIGPEGEIGQYAPGGRYEISDTCEEFCWHQEAQGLIQFALNVRRERT